MWQVTLKMFDQTDQWVFPSKAKLRFKERKDNGCSNTLDVSQWIRRHFGCCSRLNTAVTYEKCFLPSQTPWWKFSSAIFLSNNPFVTAYSLIIRLGFTLDFRSLIFLPTFVIILYYLNSILKTYWYLTVNIQITVITC